MRSYFKPEEHTDDRELQSFPLREIITSNNLGEPLISHKKMPVSSTLSMTSLLSRKKDIISPFLGAAAWLANIFDYLTLDEAVKFVATQHAVYDIFSKYCGNDPAIPATIFKLRAEIILTEQALQKIRSQSALQDTKKIFPIFYLRVKHSRNAWLALAVFTAGFLAILPFIGMMSYGSYGLNHLQPRLDDSLDLLANSCPQNITVGFPPEVNYLLYTVLPLLCENIITASRFEKSSLLRNATKSCIALQDCDCNDSLCNDYYDRCEEGYDFYIDILAAKAYIIAYAVLAFIAAIAFSYVGRRHFSEALEIFHEPEKNLQTTLKQLMSSLLTIAHDEIKQDTTVLLGNGAYQELKQNSNKNFLLTDFDPETIYEDSVADSNNNSEDSVTNSNNNRMSFNEWQDEFIAQISIKYNSRIRNFREKYFNIRNDFLNLKQAIALTEYTGKCQLPLQASMLLFKQPPTTRIKLLEIAREEEAKEQKNNPSSQNRPA